MPTAPAFDSRKADDWQRQLRSDLSQCSGLAFSKVNGYTNEQAAHAQSGSCESALR
jgi:hypothetical protein